MSTEQSAPVLDVKTEEPKQDASIASQATQEEQKTHDVQYADDETTAKVSNCLQQLFNHF